METIICYFKKTFRSETRKDAFLAATKWLATHITSDEVLKDTFSKFVELPYDKETKQYAIVIELYAGIDENASRESFCNACQEFHRKFYINSQYNCERCNMVARSKQIHERLVVKKTYRKEHLQHVIKRKSE